MIGTGMMGPGIGITLEAVDRGLEQLRDAAEVLAARDSFIAAR